jgi:hypothetical protein
MKFYIPLNLVVAMLFIAAPVPLPDHMRLYLATVSLYCLPEERIAF